MEANIDRSWARLHSTRVNSAQLLAQGSQAGASYRLLHPAASAQSPVLAGHYEVTTLRPGLQIKCTDVHDLHDMTVELEMPASVHIVVLLAGRAHASFGNCNVSLGGTASGADAAIIPLARPERFVRRSRRGAYERKVGISLEAEWLEASGLSRSSAAAAALQRHLEVVKWEPSRRAVAIATQMINPPQHSSALRHLYLESRALELIAEAFAQFEERHAPSATLTPRTHHRLRALRQWLDSGEAEHLSLDDIARHAGFNAQTLQQQFRAAFGTTIFDYLRARRLERARVALETQDISVGQAAWLAGYNSQANFSTAFKRRFGMTPKQVKRV